MYVPITSEVTIAVGLELREISSEQVFVVAERIKNSAEVSGEDRWRISPAPSEDVGRLPMDLTRQELSEKYFALVDDDIQR